MVKPEKKDMSQIGDIIKRHPSGRGSLIPVLQDIQEKFGYLSEESLNELERQSGISVNEIYGVATFYTQFRFHPPGEHVLQVCQGTACHVRGGHAVLEEMQQRLGIRAGETTKDGRYEIRRVACLGCCALAPVVTVDDKVHAGMTVKKIPAILSRFEGKKDGHNV